MSAVLAIFLQGASIPNSQRDCAGEVVDVMSDEVIKQLDLDTFLNRDRICSELDISNRLQWDDHGEIDFLDIEDLIERVHGALQSMGFKNDNIMPVLEELGSKIESTEGHVYDELLFECCNSLLNAPKTHTMLEVKPLLKSTVDVEDDRSTSENIFGEINTNEESSSNKDIDIGALSVKEYRRFIARLRRDDCENVRSYIKNFIASVLFPEDFIEDEISLPIHERWSQFIKFIIETLESHPVWACNEYEFQDNLISKFVEGLEEYVMMKIYKHTFGTSKDILESDMIIWSNYHRFHFVEPRHLDIVSDSINDIVVNLASDELRKINSCYLPSLKLSCIVRCSNVIFNYLNLQRDMSSFSRAGADDFLPLFIYVVLKARVPYLLTNCDFIVKYRNPNFLMSKAGYCFVNLRGALEFLKDASIKSFTSLPECPFPIETVEEAHKLPPLKFPEKTEIAYLEATPPEFVASSGLQKPSQVILNHSTHNLKEEKLPSSPPVRSRFFRKVTL